MATATATNIVHHSSSILTEQPGVHARTSSRDNSYCSDLSSTDLFSVEQQEEMGQTIVAEHIPDTTLMDVSLSKEFMVIEQNKKNVDSVHRNECCMEKPLYGFGDDDDEDDCTTVTLSTSTSEQSGSHNSGRKSRLGGWAARFVQRDVVEETKLPMGLMDDISPLSTPSPTVGQRKKAMPSSQVVELPPLKQFGAQEHSHAAATLQMQALEAIMAKQQEKERLEGGRWWWKNQQQQEQMQEQKQNIEEESVAAESMASNKSHDGEQNSSFRWGRFLGTNNGEEDDDEEDSLKAMYTAPNPRKSWRSRFSFRPSELDTMLDDMEDPYLDSVSLGSESSSGSGVYSLDEEQEDDDDGNNENDDSNNNGVRVKKQHRRRWSRLWRAQEFSRDAPTIHMI